MGQDARAYAIPYNQPLMVRDGIFYALGMVVIAGVISYFATPWLALPPLLLGCFFLWFFRDPERQMPGIPGAVVSPADGKVTDVSATMLDGKPSTRVSIFLNVFDVHVNRSPIAGTIKEVKYQTGKFCNAMDPLSADCNEQNVVTVQGAGQTVVFKQIAGLIARRIVFRKKVGDPVGLGERVGLIKFGSRTDVILPATADIKVKVGERVRGGASLIAVLPEGQR
jgi:phosphatidylserine decarboxylase